VNQMSGLKRLTTWFVDKALPYWLDAGFDRVNGHFVEALAPDGTAETTGVLRTRTAARQIYVYAHAHALGVAPVGSLEIAERAFANLHKCAWVGGAKPGYAFTINRFTGKVVDPLRDLYDHTCVLLALAWLAKATGNAKYKVHIAETLNAVDITLNSRHGGWAEDNDGTLPRRQNPHMHFFEACLALAETAGEQIHIDRATQLFELFQSKFFDHNLGTLREYFGPRWEVATEFNSDSLDPGHMAEWVWLLRRYQRLVPAAKVDLYCEKLLHAAETRGIQPGGNFLSDEVSAQGQFLKSTSRLWPQAELIKANVMQFEALGTAKNLARANEVATALFSAHLTQTPKGTWRDCLDTNGNNVAKSIPASSTYHLCTTVAELLNNQISNVE
jgi:mannose/cellobiose epimerase-like protein (N-acyl-D-glucosamine 2-epimerase family)